MEREVGGGIGMGNTCRPMPVSFQCMTKFTTNKKKKIKKKKNSKKKKKKRVGQKGHLCKHRGLWREQWSLERDKQ